MMHIPDKFAEKEILMADTFLIVMFEEMFKTLEILQRYNSKKSMFKMWRDLTEEHHTETHSLYKLKWDTAFISLDLC